MKTNIDRIRYHKASNGGPTSNTIFIGTEFEIFRLILYISMAVLALLFFPYIRSALLATIFAFAIVGVKQRFHVLPKYKQILLLITGGIGLITFISVFVSMVKLILSTIESASQPNAIAIIKSKLLELFVPTLTILKQYLAKLLYQMDKTRTIEARLSESANELFDSFIGSLVNWISEVPNNLLQLSFFIFLFIFLVHKIEKFGLRESDFHILKYRRPVKFLISTATKSGYNAIITTLLTALAQAIVMTLGAFTVGILAWPIVFVSAFISAMIPVVGILPVALTSAIYAGSEFGMQKAMLIGGFGGKYQERCRLFFS